RWVTIIGTDIGTVKSFSDLCTELGLENVIGQQKPGDILVDFTQAAVLFRGAKNWAGGVGGLLRINEEPTQSAFRKIFGSEPPFPETCPPLTQRKREEALKFLTRKGMARVSANRVLRLADDVR